MRNSKVSNQIIGRNQANVRFINLQTQLIQNTMSTHENVLNWKTDDARLTEDLRQQFLTKTKTRRTPTGDIYSPKERVPLATTDIGVSFCFFNICTTLMMDPSSLNLIQFLPCFNQSGLIQR